MGDALANAGPGWYEVINPRDATTCIAYVHEDGSLYLPEGTRVLNQGEFAFAAARGDAHLLVRVDAEIAHLRAGPDPAETGRTVAWTTGANTWAQQWICPDLLSIRQLGGADGWRGHVVRGFFRVLKMITGV